MVLKEQKLLIFFLDFACKFCMLQGFEEPTTPTTAEAEADSPWNPEEELPAGNPNADQRRSHQLC